MTEAQAGVVLHRRAEAEEEIVLRDEKPTKGGKEPASPKRGARSVIFDRFKMLGDKKDVWSFLLSTP